MVEFEVTYALYNFCNFRNLYALYVRPPRKPLDHFIGLPDTFLTLPDTSLAHPRDLPSIS